MKYVLAFLIAVSAFAESNRGSSDLGLCAKHYSYSNFILSFKDSNVIRTGWLDNTFNARGCPNAETLMREVKPLDLRIHILNGPGLRNQRLERHEIHAGHTVASLERAIKRTDPRFMRKFKARLLRLKSLLAKRRGEMSVAISPCLECDFRKPQRLRLLRETAKVFPGYALVDNPLRDSCLTGYLCETHNRRRKADIYDVDGNSFSVSASLEWAKEKQAARSFYFWMPCKNGRLDGQRWIPPTKRTNFCGLKENKEINFLIRAGT